MIDFKRKVDQFFFHDRFENDDFLQFFRISIGSIVLLHFLAIWSDFGLLFGTNGIIPWDIPDVMVPKYLVTLPKIIIFLEGLGVEASISIPMFKVAFCILCFCIITGVFTRVSALLLLFLQISMVKGASFFAYGVDFFTSMSLFYLVLFPTASSLFSTRFRLFRKTFARGNSTPVRRVFQLHLSIAYFFSGLGKILGFNWWNGESIWKAINLPYANSDFSFDFSWMVDHNYVLVLIGWGTIVLELLYPIFVWIRLTRKFWIILVVSMHLGIAIVLNLYYFSAIMIIWNFTAFYISKETRSNIMMSTATG